MNNSIYNTTKLFLEIGSSKLIENIKILLYKKNAIIFDFLDFEKEKPYTEPLLFAYFNGKDNEKKGVENIIYGFSDKEITFQLFSDESGKIYLPNVGWFLTNYKNDIFNFDKLNFKLFKGNEPISFVFEKLEIIENTSIELLKYPIDLLKPFYFNTENELLDVEIENITKKQIKNLTKAYQLIKENIPHQPEIISLNLQKKKSF